MSGYSPQRATSRKPPHCHKCGGPMVGHKRPNGHPVCPQPPQHDALPKLPAGEEGRCRTHNVLDRLPPRSTGHVWHWVNSNWVDPVPKTVEVGSEYHSSWISTEPEEVPPPHEEATTKEEKKSSTAPVEPPARCDFRRGHPAPGTDAAKQRCEDMFHLLLKKSAPEVMMFPASPREADIPDIVRQGATIGIYVKFVSTGLSSGIKFEPFQSPAFKHHTHCILIGREQPVVDLFEPQSIPDHNLDSEAPARPAHVDIIISFLQMLLAAALGGTILFGGVCSLR